MFDQKNEKSKVPQQISGTRPRLASPGYTHFAYYLPSTQPRSGLTVPPGKRMGHAGAIISGGTGDARTKIEVLRKSGIHVVDLPTKIGETMSRLMQ